MLLDEQTWPYDSTAALQTRFYICMYVHISASKASLWTNLKHKYSPQGLLDKTVKNKLILSLVIECKFMLSNAF